MSQDVENTKLDPGTPRRRSDLRTALAVALSALLVAGVVVGGGLAWAFWSFSRTSVQATPKGSPEPMSPAGEITPPSSQDTTNAPDVVGLKLAAATDKLRRSGLAPGAVTRVFADGFPVGAVIAQLPTAGSDTPIGGEVALTVCEGSLTAELPQVVGLTVAQAEKALSAFGLTVGTVQRVYDERIAAGIVMSVAASGARQPQRGDSVNLVASKGKAPVEMPAITGMTPVAARSACGRVGIGLTLTPAGASRGIVYRQSPAAGAGVIPGTSARAWVDTPPSAAIAARVTKLDPTWEKYNKELGAHVTCVADASDDRGVASYGWQVEGLDVSMAGTGSSISFILPGYRRYGSTMVTLTVVDSAGQATTTKRSIKLNWDTGTLQ